jgi:hypothetical protein
MDSVGYFGIEVARRSTSESCSGKGWIRGIASTPRQMLKRSRGNCGKGRRDEQEMEETHHQASG